MRLQGQYPVRSRSPRRRRGHRRARGRGPARARRLASACGRSGDDSGGISPTSSTRRARLASGGQYPSLNCPIQSSTARWTCRRVWRRSRPSSGPVGVPIGAGSSGNPVVYSEVGVVVGADPMLPVTAGGGQGPRRIDGGGVPCGANTVDFILCCRGSSWRSPSSGRWTAGLAFGTMAARRRRRLRACRLSCLRATRRTTSAGACVRC